MADIRTLTVEGTTYIIKDATARADITTLRTNVTQLQTNVTQLQTNVTQLQQNTADLPQIRENIETNANDISNLKSAFAKNQIYDSASGSIASFPDGADNEPIKELIVNVDPAQYGTGDPSPDNVRPIAGWTQAKLTRAGKNLFDETNAVIYKRYFSLDAGKTFWSYLNDSGSFVLQCKPNQTYTISCDNASIAIFRVGYITFNPDDLSNTDRPEVYNPIRLTKSGTITITTGADAKYLVVQFNSNIIYDRNSKIQIELGSTATAYETYNGNTYDFTFPSEAGTVYGGTLTVNADGTGKLLVQFNKYTPTAFNGSLGTSTNAYIAYVYISTSNHNVPLELRKNIKSNKFKYSNAAASQLALYDFGGTSGSNTTWAFALPLTITSIAEANTWLANNPIEFTYMLTEPIEYTLTAQQVFNTLYGLNYIWADTGNVSVTYPANLKLYIDKKVAR